MDGEQALSFVDKFDPDIMILDLRMPGMDGIDVLKKTKEKHPDTQVIILSGRETPKDREEAKKHGAFDFVTKPADIDMLAGKVKEAYWTKSRSRRRLPPTRRNFDGPVKGRDEAPQSLADGEHDRLLLVCREFIIPVNHHLPEMICMGRPRFRSTEARRRMRSRLSGGSITTLRFIKR
ncbi:MAG: response regulator [Desulfomicrobium escambiense]|nr:response regulator [Desulfomicrobium escambiense]